jgi:hypothetical protein
MFLASFGLHFKSESHSFNDSEIMLAVCTSKSAVYMHNILGSQDKILTAFSYNRTAVRFEARS